MIEHVYVCKKCGYTLMAEKGEHRFCKNDGTGMIDTNVTKAEWNTYSDEIHQKVISQVKETGKGVDPESLKPKPVQEKASVTETKMKSADHNAETLNGSESFRVTKGNDGSSVVHTGRIFTIIMSILSVISGFLVTMFIYEIEDLLGSINNAVIDHEYYDSYQTTATGIWNGVFVAAIGILFSVAIGKMIEGVGLTARNTYETKIMLKKALENKDYTIEKNQKESTFVPSDSSDTDQKKN